MRRNVTIVLNLDWRAVSIASLAMLGLLAAIAFSGSTLAQKSQENFKDKLDIADDMGGVAVATSADGKHVYVAGPQGVIVSSDFGKTGTWAQTVRLK